MFTKTQRDIRDDKSSLYPPNATNPSDTHLPFSNKQRTLTTSVIPSQCCDPWYDRHAHTSWMIHNQSSEPRQQTESGREREWLLVCVLSFSFFQTHYDHPSCFFLLEAAAWCLSKEVDFQSITWASNWLRTCAEMQVTPHSFSTFSTVNNSWKKVSSFSQSLPGVWKPF